MEDDFKIGRPVCPKGEKIVVYIIEILGDTFITTNGSYKKEELESVITVAQRLQREKLNTDWVDEILNKLSEEEE